MNATWLLVCGASFGAAVAGHAALCRASLALDRVTRFLLVAIPLGLTMIGALASRYELLSAELLAALLLYAFACELYIFLFTMTISSISSNLLVQLAREPMSIEKAAAKYDSSGMVRLRLERLRETGFLAEGDAGLSLSGKGRRFTRAFAALRAFFRHPPTDE